MRVAVLLSGGWDSVFCLFKALMTHNKVDAYFFDYNQPYIKHELKTIKFLQKRLDWTVDFRIITRYQFESKYGIFKNRNEKFIRYVAYYDYDVIYFGCRNPLSSLDKYKDSNRQFCNRMEKKYKVKIKTPALMLPKFIIKRYVRMFNVKDSDIFSSEGYKYDK